MSNNSKIEIIGYIKDGIIHWYNNNTAKNLLKTFEGQKIIAAVKPYRGVKTREQLGYYFAAIVDRAAEHFGYTSEEMHDILKSECNKKPVVNKITGEIIYLPRSTSTHTKEEQMLYIERCIRFLAEQGFVVETPEEYFKRITNTGK